MIGAIIEAHRTVMGPGPLDSCSEVDRLRTSLRLGTCRCQVLRQREAVPCLAMGMMGIVVFVVQENANFDAIIRLTAMTTSHDIAFGIAQVFQSGDEIKLAALSQGAESILHVVRIDGIVKHLRMRRHDRG